MLFMKRISNVLTAVAVLVSLPCLAQGDLNFNLGNGLTATSSNESYRMSMGGSVQLLGASQMTGQSSGLQAYPSLGFLRLKGSAKPESIDFLVQLNFAQATPLLDAWIRHTSRWGSRITLGQMQSVGNGLEMLVFEDLQSTPERSLLSQTFSRTGREAGIMFDHRLEKSGWGMALFAQVTSGDGQNSFGVDSRDVDLGGLKYAGRLELSIGEERDQSAPIQFAPLNSKPSVLVGLSGSYNRGASDAVGEGHGTFQMYQGATAAFPDYRKWSLDVLAMKGRFSFYGQMMYATATNLDGLQWTPSVSNLLRPQEISSVLHLGKAFTGQIEYVLPNNWGVVGRRSIVLPEFDAYAENLIEASAESLFGINRYVVSHQIKWFLGIQRRDYVVRTSEIRLSTIFQFRF